MKITAPS